MGPSDCNAKVTASIWNLISNPSSKQDHAMYKQLSLKHSRLKFCNSACSATANLIYPTVGVRKLHLCGYINGVYVSSTANKVCKTVDCHFALWHTANMRHHISFACFLGWSYLKQIWFISQFHWPKAIQNYRNAPLTEPKSMKIWQREKRTTPPKPAYLRKLSRWHQGGRGLVWLYWHLNPNCLVDHERQENNCPIE